MGRPYWYFHHMGLGETIGFSTRLTQNSDGILYSANGFQRLRPRRPDGRPHVAHAHRGTALRAGGRHQHFRRGGSELERVARAVMGYDVYRAPTAAGPFTRLNRELVTGTNYTDPVVGRAATWSGR